MPNPWRDTLRDHFSQIFPTVQVAIYLRVEHKEQLLALRILSFQEGKAHIPLESKLDESLKLFKPFTRL